MYLNIGVGDTYKIHWFLNRQFSKDEANCVVSDAFNAKKPIHLPPRILKPSQLMTILLCDLPFASITSLRNLVNHSPHLLSIFLVTFPRLSV